MNVKTHIKNIELKIQEYFEEIYNIKKYTKNIYDNKFAAYLINNNKIDLYLLVDYIYTTSIFDFTISRDFRKLIADKILQCQDNLGWFSLNNTTRHTKEHATAYAIAGLRLLEIDEDEDYLKELNPLKFLKPLISNKNVFNKWINSIMWFHPWRVSQIIGGIPAIIGMTSEYFSNWFYKNDINLDNWWDWYFSWLNNNINRQTGYWSPSNKYIQKVFNKLYPRADLGYLGGATHIYWIYQHLGKIFPYPEEVINSTMKLQKDNGLYNKHPYCIDFDANFCLLRCYLQLPENRRSVYKEKIIISLRRNVESIIDYFNSSELSNVYKTPHGIVGAVAAITEANIILEIDEVKHWKNVIDKVWWL